MRIGCVNHLMMIRTNNNYVSADVESPVPQIVYVMGISHGHSINRTKILTANLTAMLVI